MNQKFNVGDRVRCVDAREVYPREIVEGAMYEVSGIEYMGGEDIQLLGCAASWRPGRFELVTDSTAREFKAGERVQGWDENGGEAPWHRLLGTVASVAGAFTVVAMDDGKTMRFYNGNLRHAPASAEANPERTGPHGGSDLPHEQVVAALTAALPANEAARLRNVAALRAELDTSSAERRRLLARIPVGRNFEIRKRDDR